jgi:glycosyltransferase involved in cell wall biosynthesis
MKRTVVSKDQKDKKQDARKKRKISENLRNFRRLRNLGLGWNFNISLRNIKKSCRDFGQVS